MVEYNGSEIQMNSVHWEIEKMKLVAVAVAALLPVTRFDTCKNDSRGKMNHFFYNNLSD